jgi:hypothetical protein
MSTPMTEFPMPLPRTTRLLIDGGGGTTAVPDPRESHCHSPTSALLMHRQPWRRWNYH